MTTLNDYITDVRDLLHDPTAGCWNDAQLTRYINSARNRVVWLTKCARFLTPITTIVGQENYPFTTLNTFFASAIDIMNITVIWGSRRIPLNWMVWTQFNAYCRQDVILQDTPAVWSLYGQNTFCIAPLPDQVYTLEVDAVFEQAPMVGGTYVETILSPYTSPVKYYAAHLAYFYQQQTAEAQMMAREFDKDIQRVMLGVSQRRVASPYTDRR